MIEDYVAHLIFVGIAGTALVSWFAARWLRGRIPGWASVLLAGCMPSVVIILALSIWHYFELMSYRASGSHEGFMGPLLILLYGFPYLLIMAFVDFLAAWFGRTRT